MSNCESQRPRSLPSRTDLSAISAGEGGVRVNAFVGGGFLPPAVRGTKYEGLV